MQLQKSGQTNSPISRYAERQKERQTDRMTERHKHQQIYTLTQSKTGEQPDIQKQTQTDI